MDQGAFAYPKLYYFQSGNPYTGSWKGLNYKLTPKKDKESGEEALIVQVWYGPYCSEASDMVDEVTLPMTEEGLESSRNYLWEQYCLLQKKSMEENN